MAGVFLVAPASGRRFGLPTATPTSIWCTTTSLLFRPEFREAHTDRSCSVHISHPELPYVDVFMLEEPPGATRSDLILYQRRALGTKLKASSRFRVPSALLFATN